MQTSTLSTLKSESSTEIKDSREGFKFLRLAPQQIDSDWKNISEAIESALPPTSSDKNSLRMHTIYKSLMSEQAECWLLVKGEEPWVLGTFYTVNDPFTGDRNLLIFSLYGYKPVHEDLWFLMLNEIKKKAILYNCNKIIAYSGLERVVQIAKMLGWNTEFTFLFVEV